MISSKFYNLRIPNNCIKDREKALYTLRSVFNEKHFYNSPVRIFEFSILKFVCLGQNSRFSTTYTTYSNCKVILSLNFQIESLKKTLRLWWVVYSVVENPEWWLKIENSKIYTELFIIQKREGGQFGLFW